MAAKTTETDTGRSIEEMAGDEDLDLSEPETFLEGSRGQLSWQVGGLEPASSTLTVSGLSGVEVAGEFDKGEELVLLVRARVNEVTFADEDDPDGYPEGCTKRFRAKALSVERAEK